MKTKKKSIKSPFVGNVKRLMMNKILDFANEKIEAGEITQSGFDTLAELWDYLLRK